MLYYKDNKWNFNIRKDRFITENAKQGLKKLAIILESPHKDEYDANFNPIWPAQGKTGHRIEQHLTSREFIGELCKSQKYLVLLINPVQLQASCYNLLPKNELNRKLTQKVFRRLFGKKGVNLREDFIKRLRLYCPDIIVNCCTYSLKEVVETAIKEAVGKEEGKKRRQIGKGQSKEETSKNDVYIDKDTHPSTWHKKHA